jgi:hypothetical protein
VLRTPAIPVTDEDPMKPDRAAADTQKFELPQDLLSELQRRGGPHRHDFAVEGWKPSLFDRFVEKLTGRK